VDDKYASGRAVETYQLSGLSGSSESPAEGSINMRIEGRIRKLEKRMTSSPLILYFADGSTREIRGPRYFLLDLVCAMNRNPTPTQAEQLELIRSATYADEPGGGRLTELIKALPPDPADPPYPPNLAESGGSHMIELCRAILASPGGD
jgi:hypothetical protein